MNISTILSLITSSASFAAIILYGCLGEILNQKAGGLNLGVPGIMTMGGIGSVLAAYIYESSVIETSLIMCILFSLAGCLIFSGFSGLLYGFLTISLKCNQNVVGLTLTIFGKGVANFLGGILISISGGVGQIALKSSSAAFRSKIPFLSSELGIISQLFFSYGFLFYLVLLLAVLLYLFLEKNRTGLNLRAVGENPATADACGIPVTKYKYLAAVIGSLICGLGGLYYSLDYIMGTWNNDGAIEALGWLALALVIFCSWKPLRAIWGSFLFGLCYWIYLYIPANISKSIADFLNIEKVSYLQNLYKAIPYLVTIIVLIFISAKKKNNNAPAKLGINYFREDR